MDQGDIKKIYEDAKMLDPSLTKNRILIQDKYDRINDYRKNLINFNYIEGFKGNDAFIDSMGEMLAEIKMILDDTNNSENKTASIKLKWNGSLKELAWLFNELKNKPTKKTQNKINNETYLDCTIDELTKFIYANFDCDQFSESTIDQYLRDIKLRKKIDF